MRKLKFGNLTVDITLYRSFHLKRFKKGLFSTRPSSISLKISIMRVFSKKQRSISYLGQKASHKKTTGLSTFRFSTISLHTFFDNSRSFYCRNLCLSALEGYFIEQNSKNKKNQQQFF
jgi:hypothetical protein